MKSKTILIALASLFIFTGCNGKNRQPKTETLWDEENKVETTAQNEIQEEPVKDEFIFPKLSKENDTATTERRYFNNMSLLITYDKMNKFQTIDSTEYYIEYQTNYVPLPGNSDYDISDKQVLQIGKQNSKSFSKVNFGDGLSKPKKPTAASAPVPPATFPQVIYQNYPEGKLTGVYLTPLNSGMLRYTETIPKMDWKIGSEQKKILNYNCQKATADFRGRTYTAWFTVDLPIKGGPWKFHGLPGLILEVVDSKSEFHFLCAKVEKLSQSVPILFWEWNFKNTTRTKMNAALIEIHKYPLRYFENSGAVMTGFGDDLMLPYNPIELE